MGDVHGVSSGLIGRDVELDVIATMLSGVTTTGEALLFVGEPGVGKTALLNVAAEQAAEAGYQVVRVDGIEFEADIGFSALSQAVLPLEHLLATLDAVHRDALLVALGLSEGSPPDRLVVSTAALRLFQLAGESSGVLVVIDDLQWVDRASAEVFLFVARRARGRPVGFLATARPGTDAFFAQASLEERELAPLDEAAAGVLLRARFPTLAQGVRRRLLAEARGNPLALLELPAQLSGPAHRSDDALPLALPLSRRLQAMYSSRIGSMPPATRDLLVLASLEGTGDWQVLREATGDPALVNLAPAERAGLLRLSRDDYRLTFEHPLIRSAVVALASAAELRSAHRRIAEVLEAHPDRRAWHLAEATVTPDERVANLLEQAARRAVARGDRGAGEWYFKAADRSPDAAERSRRHTEAAWYGAFRRSDAEPLSQLLASLPTLEPGSDEALYAAVSASFLVIKNGGDVRTAVALVWDALDAVRPGDRADPTAVHWAIDMSASICHQAAQPDCSAQHHRILDRLAAFVPERSVLFAHALFDPAHKVLGVLERIDRALASIDRTEDQMETILLAASAIYTDRLAAARPALERLVGSDPSEVASHQMVGAMGPLWQAQFTAGDWEAARRTSRTVRRLTHGQSILLLDAGFDYLDGWLAALTGDADTVARMVQRLHDTAETHNARLFHQYRHHVLTIAAAGIGDFEGAFRHADAVSAAGTLAEETPTALWVFHELVDAAVHTGRAGEAQRHVAAVTDLRVGEISPRLAMLSDAARALVTPDPGEAAGLFTGALERAGVTPWPFDVARVRLSFGEHLRLANTRQEARRQLEGARDGFAALGATPWVARADAQLERLTGHSEAVEEIGGLTLKEYEVAQLAARGLTNKQIAAELYLSPRTVGTYLYRAFPKLGISTRAGLRDALTGLSALSGDLTR